MLKWCLLFVYILIIQALEDNHNDVNLETTTATPKCNCLQIWNCELFANGTLEQRFTDLDHQCDDFKICCGFLEEKTTNLETSVIPEPTKSCGFRNPPEEPQYPSYASFAEFPWMVALFSEKKKQIWRPNKTKFIRCGGSLIHPQVVLTAAHCVKAKYIKYKIRAGVWNIFDTNESLPHQDRDVKLVITHPDYERKYLNNNIALLILEEPVKISKNVDTVCLPPQNAEFDNAKCIGNGWGKSINGSKRIHKGILKKIELPIVNREVCESNLRAGVRCLTAKFTIDETHICAGGEDGVDMCKGDGGGPLVCPIREHLGRYVQVGIVSWGYSCGTKGIPGGYTNVAKFRNWIDEQMVTNNFDTSSYQV